MKIEIQVRSVMSSW